jgi:hypothetical protein
MSIVTAKERSFMLRRLKDKLLLQYDKEEDVEKQADILNRIEDVENELAEYTT